MSKRIPEVYEEFKAQFPEAVAAFEQFASVTHEAGPLDQKQQRLSKLGMAVGAGSPGGVRSQVRKALDEGFTRAEIEHVILLSATTIGLPLMIAAWQWSREIPD